MAHDQIFEVTTPASLSPVLLQKHHQWPIIARDLALLTDTQQTGSMYNVSDIAKAYGLKLEELSILLEVPAFQKLIKEEKHKLEAEPHGGHKLRAEIMATDLQEVLYLRAKEGTAEPAVILKFLEHLARVAGIDGVDNKDKDKGNINQNAISVNINIPRLNNPKLNHLYDYDIGETDMAIDG